MAARKHLSAREAAIKVLTDQDNKPMNIGNIVKAAFPLTKLSGKNPEHGIRVQLVTGANKDNGWFERTGKGMYRVRRNRLAEAQGEKVEAPKKQAAKKNGPKKQADDAIEADLKRGTEKAKGKGGVQVETDPKPSGRKSRSKAKAAAAGK